MTERNKVDSEDKIGEIDPEEIVRIICLHFPEWSREDILRRVLEALGTKLSNLMSPVADPE